MTPRVIPIIALIAFGSSLRAQAPTPTGPAVRPPLVSPAAESKLQTIPREDVDAMARSIDNHINRRLLKEKVSASPLASDAEFLRRVYLDLTGKVPAAAAAAAFLDDPSPGKRPKVIDELLAGSDFGQHLADLWQALLLPRNSENRGLAIEPFAAWLAEQFNGDKPWDQVVKQLLTVSGDSEKERAIQYFLANRELDKITDNVSRSFLGVQLQCAQCHNHPFTEWKQDEYWGMAAFFAKVRFQGNPRMAARRGASIIMSEDGRGRPLPLPDSGKTLPPKFLASASPVSDVRGPLRPLFADWLTKSPNPYFGKAMVNRVWGQLFGRGIVNPVDDMHDGNAPSHPELLKELTAEFVAHRFDVKFLYRSMCNSQAYQRTSKPVLGNAEAVPETFARMAIKPLSPEQLYDSLVLVFGGAPGQSGPMGRKQQPQALRGPNANPRNFFVSFFQNEDGGDPTEYSAGIPQVLRLMNWPLLNNAARLHPAIRKGGEGKDILDGLFLSVLGRRPTQAESNRLAAHMTSYRYQPVQGYADIVWALMNSSEFVLNH